jgi:integrase
MQNSVTTKIDVHKGIRSAGHADTTEYLVQLRVTCNREQHYYKVIHPEKKTPLYFTEENFDRIMNPKARGTAKDMQLVLIGVEKDARKIIEAMPVFSFEAFKTKFTGQKSDSTDVLKAFDRYIDLLDTNERVGTAANYKAARNSLSTYTGGKLLFSHVNQDFLMKYEKSMIGEGKSTTTIGIYLRELRTIVNKAIGENAFKREDYPFGHGKYQIPSSSNIKKALDKGEIRKIFDYKGKKGSWEERARDFWVFSYLCNGINMKDIALLKWKNVDGDHIEFKRAKTANTRRTDSMPIKIYLTKESRNIINRQGDGEGSPENFIFPILDKKMSAKAQRATISQFIKMVNTYMANIGKELKMGKKLNTYSARHSYATVLMHSGVTTEFISGQLGHTSIRTTQSYLDSFGNDAIKKNAQLLTDF